jgi:maltose/maltodextrin transport system permease protein
LHRESGSGRLIRTVRSRAKDGTVIRPDFRLGFFVNDKGEKVGVGFRTFSAFDNYLRIITDPRIQGPFFRIFLWTVAFSTLSMFLVCQKYIVGGLTSGGVKE